MNISQFIERHYRHFNAAALKDAADGYIVGSLWLNTATGTTWVCTDATTGAAVWKSSHARDDEALTLIPEETDEAVVVAGNLGVGVDEPKARLHATESTVLGAADAALADGDLGNGQVNLWLDETTGSEKVKFKVKLSSGTVKSGEISLS